MNCLKCGREISEDEVFCIECQLEAQMYPIDPGAAVYLPKRVNPETAKKMPRKKPLSMEEQLRLQRKRIRNLTIGFAVAAALVLAMAYPAITYFFHDHYKRGQNYTPMTTIPPATVPVAEVTD